MSVLRALGQAFRSVGQAVEAVGRNVQGLKQAREAVSNHQTLMPLNGHVPLLGNNVFVAPSASVLGRVHVGEGSSIWYNAVLRGDVNDIKIGNRTNVQDNVTIHTASDASGAPKPTIVGNDCTIGHNVVLHACTIEDGCLVGMGSTLLDGVTLHKGSIVGAGSLVLKGTTVPSGEIWVGAPARFLRKLTEEEVAFVEASAANYAELAAKHAEENSKTFDEVEDDKVRRKDRLERDPDYDSHVGVLRDPVSRKVLKVAQ